MTTTPSRRTVLTAGAVSAVGLVATGALTAPRPALLGSPAGDRDLADALAPQLQGHRTVAAIHLPPGDAPTRFAGFGAGAHHEFEIGSVTKTFTGALLAEQIERSDLTLKTTVADIVDAGRSEIADVTLAELADHSSGLPRLDPRETPRAVLGNLLHDDPYTATPDEVIAHALETSLSGRGTETYSNFGFALLGQLLARSARRPYAKLVGERILHPLGLDASYVPVTAQRLGERARRGHTTAGLPAGCWTMHGTAPAGGLRSTAHDLARYLRGMIDGSAPGSEAARKVLHEQDGRATAMAWVHQELPDGTPIIWHNGMTGGYASFVGWNEKSGEGIGLLTDTARSVDELALAVLSGEVTV